VSRAAWASAGIIRLHALPALRAGASTTDAHLVVPEFWSVERAHAALRPLRREVIQLSACRANSCSTPIRAGARTAASATSAECPVRAEPFRSRAPLTLEEAVRPDEAAVR